MLEQLKEKILIEFNWLDVHIDEKDEYLIIEEDYEMTEDEKNSDDCCDVARENGEMIVAMFPELEIVEYYCHRSKYAIVNLKLKI